MSRKDSRSLDSAICHRQSTSGTGNDRLVGSELAEPGDYMVSYHAQCRMATRRISIHSVIAALTHGRVVHSCHFSVHAIGRREVSRLNKHGVDLSEHEGVQVIVAGARTVVTVYRDEDFRRLRPRRRRRVRRYWAGLTKRVAG